MLKGRLGLETARIPHADRHGLLWLEYGRLTASDGSLVFQAAPSRCYAPGHYSIPFQTISIILLGPGTSLTHDVLRLMARHGCGLAAIGEEGVRFYTAMPLGPNESMLARLQTMCWSDCLNKRQEIIRKMYAVRLDEIFPDENINVLRGIEGARMKVIYQQLASRYKIQWKGRRYDRTNPNAADIPNQTINHAATAVESAALIAIAATGTIPQLGFIHEDSTNAFALDIADLFRHSFTIPIAFQAVHLLERKPEFTPDKAVRTIASNEFRNQKLISQMIDVIKQLFADYSIVPESIEAQKK